MSVSGEIAGGGEDHCWGYLYCVEVACENSWCCGRPLLGLSLLCGMACEIAGSGKDHCWGYLYWVTMAGEIACGGEDLSWGYLYCVAVA